MVVSKFALAIKTIVEGPAPLLNLVTQLLEVREEDVVRLELIDSLLNLQSNRDVRHKDINLLLGVKLSVVMRVARVENNGIVSIITTVNLV